MIIRIFSILMATLILATLLSCWKSDPTAEAQEAIAQIWAMSKVYKAQHGTYPQSINELDLNKLKLKDSVRKNWSFSLYATSNEMQSISATSTSEMKGGPGKVITYNTKSGYWSGYGYDSH